MIELAVLTIILVGFILFSQANKKKQLFLSQTIGLVHIQDVKKIIGYTQKHRGLTSALLSGNNSVEQELRATKGKIKQVVWAIQNTNPILEHARFDGYVDHWQRLDVTKSGMTVLDNFTQHTKLIENLFYLLEDIAEDHCLNGAHLPLLPAIGLTWRELIQTAECVGQCRAIGVGIATNQVCTPVDKIRLGYLQQQLKNTAHNVLDNLSSIEPFSFDQKSRKDKVFKRLLELDDVIEQQFIQAEKVSLDAKAYFELATTAMDSIYEIFNMQVEQVVALLEKQKTPQNVKQMLATLH